MGTDSLEHIVVLTLKDGVLKAEFGSTIEEEVDLDIVLDMLYTAFVNLDQQVSGEVNPTQVH